MLTQLALAAPLTRPLLEIERQVLLGDFQPCAGCGHRGRWPRGELCDKWGLVELPQRQKGPFRAIERGFVGGGPRLGGWRAALPHSGPSQGGAVTHTCVKAQHLQIPPNKQPPVGKRHFAIPTAALRPSVFQRELQQRLMRCPGAVPGARRLKWFIATARSWLLAVQPMLGLDAFHWVRPLT